MHRSPPAESSAAESPLDVEYLRSWALPDDGDGDKRRRGTVLVVGGSEQTAGGALLAGRAALRVGAGRLQLATDRSVRSALAVTVPEARVLAYDDRDALAALVRVADAVVMGPGLLDRSLVAELLALVVDQATGPVVVDAAALGAVASVSADRPGGRSFPVVLTPNREELQELLAGEAPARPESAAASRFGATVASFGRVAAPDGRVWCASFPVRGLGTSGSGDVLAGAVGGLAARTGEGVQSACWATALHRMAGARLAARIAPLGYLASELADELAPTLAAVEAGRPD